MMPQFMQPQQMFQQQSQAQPQHQPGDAQLVQRKQDINTAIPQEVLDLETKSHSMPSYP